MIICRVRSEVRPPKLARTLQHCPNRSSDHYFCSIANTCRPNYRSAQTLRGLVRGNKVKRCGVQWSLSSWVRSLTMKMAKCALQDRPPQSRTINPSTKAKWSRQTLRTWRRQAPSSRVQLRHSAVPETTINKTANTSWMKAMPEMEIMTISRSIPIIATEICKGISVFIRHGSQL